MKGDHGIMTKGNETTRIRRGLEKKRLKGTNWGYSPAPVLMHTSAGTATELEWFRSQKQFEMLSCDIQILEPPTSIQMQT